MQHLKRTWCTVQNTHFAWKIRMADNKCQKARPLAKQLNLLVTLFDNFTNGIEMRPIQIAAVFTMFQKLVGIDFLFHFPSFDEPISLTIFFKDTRRSRCI